MPRPKYEQVPHGGLDEYLLDISVRKWEQGPAVQVVNKDKYYGVIDRKDVDGRMKIFWTPDSRAEGALRFFDEVTHFIPKSFQEETLFLLYRNRRACVRAPRGAGKSAIMANIILHFTAMNNPCKVPTTASSWQQLEEFLWPEIHLWCNRADWTLIGDRPIMNVMDMRFGGDDLEKSTSKAFAIRSDEPHRLEGAHSEHVLIAVDEAKSVEDGMFDAVEGTLSKGDKFILVESTPGESKGKFYLIQSKQAGYEDWFEGVKHVTYDEIRDSIQDAEEREEYIQWAHQRMLQWGEESENYQNQVLGNFANTSQDGLIPLSWVEAANRRWNEWAAEGFPDHWPGVSAPLKIGVDAAGSGKDKTTIALRHGRAIREIKYYPKTTSTQVTSLIMALLSGPKPYTTAHIEVDGGYGSGAFDQCVQAIHGDAARLDPQDRQYYGRQITAIVSGSAAVDFRGVKLRDRTGELTFRNRRSYMWYRMRELLDPAYKEEIMLPPDKLLTGDLTGVKYRMAGGMVAVDSKDDTRKLLKRSTDSADATIFAFESDGSPITVSRVSVAPSVRMGMGEEGSFYDAVPDWRRSGAGVR